MVMYGGHMYSFFHWIRCWPLDWGLYIFFKVKEGIHQFLFCLVFLVRNGCYILSDVSSVSREMTIWFFPLNLLTLWNIIIAFLIMNHPCILIINPIWSQHIFWMCCWLQFANILFMFFPVIFVFHKHFWFPLMYQLQFYATLYPRYEKDWKFLP